MPATVLHLPASPSPVHLSSHDAKSPHPNLRAEQPVAGPLHSFLWEAYTNLFGGSFLEQEAFEAKNILALSEGPSLEVRFQEECSSSAVPSRRPRQAASQASALMAVSNLSLPPQARLQAAVPGWKRKFAEEKEKDPLGAPRMLIVASSALVRGRVPALLESLEGHMLFLTCTFLPRETTDVADWRR